MSADADQPSSGNVAERKFARDAGTVWGMILDHLVTSTSSRQPP